MNRLGPIPDYRPDLGACWLWTGGTQKGYGAFHVGAPDKIVGAHVWSYIAHRGAIGGGLEIDHLCRVRACVNPAHLEAVTKRENILRGESVSARYARRTHCKHGHAYVESNIYRRPGYRARICRTCMRVRDDGRRRG